MKIMPYTTILIRHAESKWNAGISRKYDGGLTQNGKDSCRSLIFDVDLVICSSLKRARDTLKYSNITYKDILYTDTCSEVNDLHIEDPTYFSHRIEDFKQLVADLHRTHETICIISHKPILKALTDKEFANVEHMTITI
jgi:phosphohistidine phosphatase SixA